MTKVPGETPVQEKKRQRPVWMLAVGDLLLTGLVLCIFALFHHVLPRLRADGPAAPIAPLERPVPTAAPAPAGTAGPAPERPLTWREKFAEHFSDAVETGENFYTSPNVSVAVARHRREMGGRPVTYFVADIYVADIDCFLAGLPGEGLAEGETIAAETGAVLAMNGDMGTRGQNGLCVRNGDLYTRQANTADLCVLWYDGTVETYEPGEYVPEELLAAGPYQIWNFGPALLEKDGTAKTKFNQNADMIMRTNPRSGLGYYEPGHYCFVVADGRQPSYSVGVEMTEWAALFEELGCACAYNMDGGGSSVMVLNGTTVNSPSGGGRLLSDMLIIREPDAGGEEGAEP